MLTTVANAFSSLYSQVSGTPLQRIGSVSSVASTKEAADSPPPLMRSNTANRLMKTLSKLNLCVDKTEKGEGSPPITGEKGRSPNVSLCEDGGKTDPKLPKVIKKKESSSMLATVTEEVSGSSSTITDSADADRLSDEADSTVSHKMEGEQSREAPSQENKELWRPVVTGADSGRDVSLCGPGELEGSRELKNAHAPGSEKEPCAPLAIPSIRNIMVQQKDSFEMEEVGKRFPDTTFQVKSQESKLQKVFEKWEVANRLTTVGAHPPVDFLVSCFPYQKCVLWSPSGSVVIYQVPVAQARDRVRESPESGYADPSQFCIGVKMLK